MSFLIVIVIFFLVRRLSDDMARIGLPLCDSSYGMNETSEAGGPEVRKALLSRDLHFILITFCT